MTTFGIVLVGLGFATFFYSYIGYPLILWTIGLVCKRREVSTTNAELPRITIAVPVHNEEASIEGTLEQLLAIEYPSELVQLIVVSDASTDDTENIVRRYSDRGVQLVALKERRGKTAAENELRNHAEGEIVINVDATTRVPPDAVKHLVSVFSDPSIGVASGRDRSVADLKDTANIGESGYVGYEMWVRQLETNVYGIVGASGCFFASRRRLHETLVPEALSRDFAAPLIAREMGYRAVSVPKAICFVPRTKSLHAEYRRKVRTMARGIETLFFKRGLLNPFKYGVFAWMLFSHKLARWLVPWGGLIATVGLALVAVAEPWARIPAMLAALSAVLAIAGWVWPKAAKMPMVVSMPTYLFAGTIAGLHAWLKAMRGELDPVWSPTRRDS